MKSSSNKISGQCLCEAIQYEVINEFKYALNCHCSKCRRATGAAFKSFGGIESSKLKIVKGEDQLLIFGQEKNHDAHCKHCGSLLYSLIKDGERVHVTYGTLSQAPNLRPSAHIYVGSKAPWFDITDNLPQHEEL